MKNGRRYIHVFCIFLLFCLQHSTLSAFSWSLENELRTYVKNHYPWNDIQISDIQVMGQLADDIPERIIVEKGPLGKAVFSLLYQSREKKFVKAQVRAFDWVVKSKRPYRRGHVIREDELYREKIDIQRIPNGAVKNMSTVVGKSLKRSIIANSAITENMVERSQVVKKGKRVTLLFKRGGLKITAAGKIAEKGFVGSAVRAVNLSSNKEVRGVLVDENTVNVLL